MRIKMLNNNKERQIVTFKKAECTQVYVFFVCEIKCIKKIKSIIKQAALPGYIVLIRVEKNYAKRTATKRFHS